MERLRHSLPNTNCVLSVDAGVYQAVLPTSIASVFAGATGSWGGAVTKRSPLAGKGRACFSAHDNVTEGKTIPIKVPDLEALQPH